MNYSSWNSPCYMSASGWIVLSKHQHNFFWVPSLKTSRTMFYKALDHNSIFYRKLLRRAEDKSYVLTALYLTKDINYSTQGSIAQGLDSTALHLLTSMLQWDLWSFQSALISNSTHIIPHSFPSWPYTEAKLHAAVPCYHGTDCWTESVIHDSDNIHRNKKLTGITLTLNVAPVFAYSLVLFIIQNTIYYKTR